MKIPLFAFKSGTILVLVLKFVVLAHKKLLRTGATEQPGSYPLIGQELTT